MADGRVLLICYYFPPLGGAGVGRPLTLFRRLSDFGYTCDVLTVKPVAYRFYEKELLADLDKARIYRSGSRDPQRIMYLLGMRKIKDSTISRGKKVSDRFFPDPKIGWVKPAINLGRVLIENKNYSCIVSTSPPISTHLIGMKLAGEFNLPWIADFRDFWTGYKAEDWFVSRSQIEKAQSLLKTITDAASAVTVTNPAIADYLGRGEVIHNSFDEDRARLWGRPQREHFVIGVLGTIDELRPVEPLLKLVAALKAKAPHAYERVRIMQVGHVNLDSLDSLLEQYDLKERCDRRGFLPREETVRCLSASSMLYIGLDSTFGKGIVPGRLFDMIASGRPILAAVDRDGEVARLVKETGNGIGFDDDNFDECVEYLVSAIDSHAREESNCRPGPPYAAKYSSSAMTKRFADLITRISEKSPAT
ncbi:MAG: hypothetical protein AB1483_08800 [Candidatus Zixiibacteriota bacterium]